LLSGKGPLALSSIHGQMAQFSGVVNPEHWWFRLSQEWREPGLQPGAAVQFTAKEHPPACSAPWW
jgi:hypothetical protein